MNKEKMQQIWNNWSVEKQRTAYYLQEWILNNRNSSFYKEAFKFFCLLFKYPTADLFDSRDGILMLTFEDKGFKKLTLNFNKQ